MEMDDECLLLNDKTACIEGFKKNLVDSLISKQNINLLNDEIFQENVKRFSRYTSYILFIVLQKKKKKLVLFSVFIECVIAVHIT